MHLGCSMHRLRRRDGASAPSRDGDRPTTLRLRAGGVLPLQAFERGRQFGGIGGDRGRPVGIRELGQLGPSRDAGEHQDGPGAHGDRGGYVRDEAVADHHGFLGRRPTA